MRPLNPGELRHKIEILEPPSERGALGEVAGDRKIFKRTFAAVKPLLGRELYAAMAAESLVRVKFIMRYVPGVNESMMIRCNGKLFAVVSAQNVNALDIETVCYCREAGCEG